jgi:hypothetical protein
MDSISHVADSAVDQVKKNASFAKGNLLELGTQTIKFITAVREMQSRGTMRMLGRLGLQRRRSRVMPAIWFFTGALAAGVAVLMLAPASGQETRSRLNRKLDQGLKGAKEAGKHMEGAMSDARSEMKARMSEPTAPSPEG